jgi:hypothetical protein
MVSSIAKLSASRRGGSCQQRTDLIGGIELAYGRQLRSAPGKGNTMSDLDEAKMLLEKIAYTNKTKPGSPDVNYSDPCPRGKSSLNPVTK